MPDSFVTGIDAQTQEQMCDVLNARLVQGIDLRLAVKQAHWNMRGKGFIGVHELLDEVSARLGEGTDMMAERVALMGGIARGTTQTVAERSDLPAYPVELVALDGHVDALVERFKQYGKYLRDGIEAADAAGDEDTADLLTEVSRMVEKDTWFIGSNAAVAA
ncbi:DNA starvation/stationary phase protection protein Dps [Jannaschia seohaensis]|uniref:Starvation-inducible DNA-binding protein n=1 Tax=Jannaschia seohaensis TaxID=475081 RepID=A0A2Y9B3W2_9RHOB|nr:DNA starvation/stationary phase protection protein Dps [Jannaschia seohaensis]PWJ12093.1 starvation-inducible DNA-binding protein [Jannaschia seohaensis]SSA51196.1 starvation-inducible DNA-binding protein [Jannaschia seohaensis]